MKLGAYVGVMAVLLSWLGCNRGDQGQPVTAFGTIEAVEALLGPEVAGRIVAIPVREGERVAEGDVLLRLDDSAVQLQLRQTTDAALRAQLELQADRYTIRAPISGTLTRVPAHVGEVAAPGQTLLAVADLSHLELTAYILERSLGQVRAGQRVTVVAEPLPGVDYLGVVGSIKSNAEFTPRNVQTARDRQNLVFGVKVRVDNPDGSLKPGMPAQVTFWPTLQ